MTFSLLLPSTLLRCSNHGQCRVTPEQLFECRCYDGWDGPDCSVPLEKDCKDGKDNDKGKNKFLLLAPVSLKYKTQIKKTLCMFFSLLILKISCRWFN
jgi:EGF-like domain